MRVEIAKRADSAGVLRCTRDDGSIAWQKQPRHGAHFALHDLTHFAVETSLGYSQGFFGLIASGWDFEDVTGKGSRGALPDEALEVERIVGLFDSERASASLWTVEEFNQFAPRPLTTDENQTIRACRADLFKTWSSVPAGQSLNLDFKSPSTVSAGTNR
jgi:hypothetical protein